ncbi:MAG: protein of unknown function DUF305 [uncultured Nocardioides sp.]|uniref:DUF305 domain-containing protein n=1 Tax=uncultured Nocardioides sp. TaxID=198441 RepID=A0A6J4N6W0_9ACTN|nr:MAG: protein of unknown function DUF305 [uncultured Nocardioides sp.]
MGRSATSAVAVVVVLAALSSCSADDQSEPGQSSQRQVEPDVQPEATEDEQRPGGVVTLQPGLPGEAASTGPVEVPEPEPENHSDIAFMQMMIPHHAQAVTMAKLAEERAQDPAVRRLADRIKAAQGPEILFMAAWLEERGLDVPSAADDPESFDHGAHGHEGMEGMLTPGQMKALRQARGKRFDELFLRQMIQHHSGAIQMAGVAAEEGVDRTVAEVAADVSVTQSAEIGRIEDLLRDL